MSPRRSAPRSTDAQPDEGRGSKIQQSPAEASEGAGAPLQEASRQVTAGSFRSNNAMQDLQLEFRDSQVLSPAASGEAWSTKPQTVDQLLQSVFCSLIPKGSSPKKLRMRISVCCVEYEGWWWKREYDPPSRVGDRPTNQSAKFGEVAKNQNFGCSTD